MNKAVLLLSIIIWAIGVSLYAQDDNTATDALPAIVTDRPDATESAYTVPKGYFQIETGTFYESYKEANVKWETYGYNNTLLRYGLLDNMELRLGWNFEEIKTEVNGVELEDVMSGFSPLLVGAKVEISEEKGLLPDMAILAHLILPLGAGSDFRPETTGADLRLSFAHTISENSGLGYNLGAQWGGDSPEIAYLYTISYGHALGNVMGLYAELYGDLPEDSRANHFWDAGCTFLLMDNLQLDATVGTSITDGQDILLSLGASVRFPN